MIVAERKKVAEIKELLESYTKILIAGCGTCMSVCMAGGEKEVGILATLLRMIFNREQREIVIGELTIQRQCDREFIQPFQEEIRQYQAVLSLGCGIGVQFLAEYLDDIPVLPGLNTKFLGSNESLGVWRERCRACGDCILGETGGICPVTLCSKNLLNGPCGGTNKGKCETDRNIDCAWTLIYQRQEKLGALHKIRKIFPPMDHRGKTAAVPTDP